MVRLRPAAEDLQLDRDPDQQRQHHAYGDHAHDGLHGRARCWQTNSNQSQPGQSRC